MILQSRWSAAGTTARSVRLGRCARLGLALGLVLSGPACLAPLPAHGVDGAHGIVWSDALERAEVVSRLLDECVPGVDALFPDGDMSRHSVRVEDSLAPWIFLRDSQHLLGLAVDNRRRVVLRWDDDEGLLKSVLAHELVHVRMAPRVWRGLPMVLEDALCDAVALHVAPSDWTEDQQGLMSLWALYALTGEPPVFRVEWSLRGQPEDFMSMGSISPGLGDLGRDGRLPPPRELLMSGGEPWDRDEGQAALGLAAFVVNRIVARKGLEGTIAWLRGWVADGSAPDEHYAALLRAAELTADESGWAPTLRGDLTPDVLARIVSHMFERELAQGEDARRHAVGLARSVGSSWTLAGVSDPETIWSEARPRFVLEDTDLAVPMRDVAPLRALAEDIWSRMRAGTMVPESPD